MPSPALTSQTVEPHRYIVVTIPSLKTGCVDGLVLLVLESGMAVINWSVSGVFIYFDFKFLRRSKFYSRGKNLKHRRACRDRGEGGEGDTSSIYGNCI